MIEEKDLKQFKRIEFVKTPEMTVIYVIEPNARQNDSQIQPVSR